MAILLALSLPAAAQKYPTPVDDSKPVPKCIGCEGDNVHQQANDGLKMTQFSDPIVAHVGRTVDATSTQHYQGPGFRTGRAGKIMTARTQRGSAPPRAYMRIGEAIFAWKLDTFFTVTLPGGPKAVNEFAPSVSSRVPSRPPYEKILMPEGFIYPEYSGSGWQGRAGDVQNTFGDLDFDDRGYIYAGMKDHGWGIVKDSGETGKTPFPLISRAGDGYQMPGNPTIPQNIVSLKVGNKYYVAISDATGQAVNLFDATNPATPTALGAIPRTGTNWGIVAWSKTDSGDRFAYIGGDGKLYVFEPGEYVTAGSPITTLTSAQDNQKRFLDLDFDEQGNLWIAEGRFGSPVANVLRKLTKTGAGYTEASFNVYGENFSPHRINVSDGYIVLSGWGIGSDGSGSLDVKLIKIESASSLRLIDLNKFFSKYYHRAPVGYAQPQVNPPYTSSPLESDVHVIKHGGKLYLMYNAWGVGDVYQIDDGGSINATMKTTSFGTKNPHSKGTGGPFYGDVVIFNGSSSVPGSGGLIWDFGNPEAGTSGNIANSANGADVTHQYIGLSTADDITDPKTVNIYEAADQGISTSLTVNLKVPAPRVTLPDGTTVTSSTSGVNVVVGEKFSDASDGAVEGHFATWTAGTATPVKALPTVQQIASTIGAHTLTFTGTYGLYDPDSFVTNKPVYTTTPITIGYTARPFVFTFKPATKSGNTVTFGATGRKTTDATIMAATTWTVTWSLKKNNADVVPPQVTNPAIGTITNFPVNVTIPSGSTLKLTVAVDPANLLTDTAKAYAEYSQEMTLDAPDPKINKGTNSCKNAFGPCTFTAGSVAGSMDGWTYAWSIKLGTTQVATGNEATFSPSLSAPGTYVVSLTATKSIFSTTVTDNVVVAAALCGPPPHKDFTAIAASCDTGCAVNTAITFRGEAFGYQAQDCDQWIWNFGDGTIDTINGKNGWMTTHAFATNKTYTVRLTIKNAAGETVVDPKTVIVGSSTPPPPPPTCTAPNSITFGWEGQTSDCHFGVDCHEGESIRFTPLKNSANLQTCDSVTWNWGDGTPNSSSKSPSHSFSEGTYTVSLTVTNEKGTSQPFSRTIKVVKPATGGCTTAVPEEGFYIFYLGRESGCTQGGSKLCEPGETIDFKALPFFGYNFQSCDKFEWTFGDGTKSTQQNVEHLFPANDNTFVVSLKVSNTHGGWTTTEDVRFTGASTTPPPVLTPNFPKTGAKGVPLTFIVNSTLPNTTGWTWNFDDGTGNNSSQAGVVSQTNSITHTFTAAGTYDVTVQARNSQASSTALTAIATDRIVISDVPVYTFLLPAVINDDGQNGSKWRTDVQVYYGAPSPQATPLSMTASFNGQNTQLLINQATFIYENFMTQLTSSKAQGSVIITTQSAHKPQIWTRTYNVDASGKTYGQYIPAVELTTTSGAVDGLADPSRYYLAGLRQDSRYRTNIGLINTTTTNVLADIIAYDDLNNPLDHFTEELTPFSLKSFSLGRVANLSNRPVTLQITVPAGKQLVGYASFIDGRSNDPVYISATSDATLAQAAFGTSITPGVGRTGDWRSDVTIFNPDDRNEATFDLEYYDGSGFRRGLATNIKLGPLQSKNYEDLLAVEGLWPSAIPPGVGMLKLTTRSLQDRYPLTFSRTYNDKGSGGTFGQGIPGIAASLANVKNGQPAVIAGVRSNANYKTNIGLTNTTANAVNVRVQLLDPNTGVSIPAAEASFPLGGYASVIGEFDFKGLQTGTLKVEIVGGDGAVWAFCSVIDKNSNDPEYVPAFPIQ